MLPTGGGVWRLCGKQAGSFSKHSTERPQPSKSTGTWGKRTVSTEKPVPACSRQPLWKPPECLSPDNE